MARTKPLLLTALSFGAALGMQTPGFAQQDGAKAEASSASTQEQERATNTALLNALLKRRAEIVQASRPGQDVRYALEFLDTRIAKLRHELKK